ncbi:MAG: type II secretion system protein GspG [Minisyncoccota bacterium]
MTESPEINKISRGYYVLGGLSYIPLIGIVFGVISIVIGAIKYNKGGKGLFYIGIGGILFSVIMYGSLFYFGFIKKGGIYDDLRLRMAKSNLTSLVESIEYYNLQNGKYPESLDILAKSMPKEKPVFIYDPTKINILDNTNNTTFYCQIVEEGKAYYLLGVGSDNKPFTADDILPEIDMTKGKNIGLRIQKYN